MGRRTVVATSFCLTAGLVGAAQATLPDGEGKPTVEAACAVRCHPPGTVLRAKRTPAGWEAIIDQMIERGAEVSDEEYDIILDYLSEHLLATVNVNTAAAAAIVEILEIGPKQAAALVEAREKRGPFRTWEEVARVPGVDAKIIEERKRRLVFD